MHFEDGTHVQAMVEYQRDTFQQGYTQKDGASVLTGNTDGLT
jgi:hypothetical protein